MLHEIFYIRSFDEPWWMPEGWQENIVSRKKFPSAEQAEENFHEEAQALALKFTKQKREGRSIAFWNPGDLAYCSNCEEDLQVYHGLLWLKDGEFVN
ncbi:DUF1033 family protein [Planococcus sp. FY231025]|uniref:DUF1033 family protein n=1 Tax=Planococcus sp. FY231025 TaxID=3455699 RepID=UPI003F90C802